MIMVGAVLPIAIAWNFGALGIPRNDDWSYLLASFRFVNGDGIDGNGWALMNLVGQLVLAWPVNLIFGNRVAPLQFLVATLGVIGLVALYDLTSSLSTRRRALFAACLLAIGPMWAALVVSFMTDIPTFSLSLICVAAGARALDRGPRADQWLAVSLVAGFAGFAIRQYAIVAVVAVVLAVIWHRVDLGPRRVYRILGFGAVIMVAMAGFYWWRLGLPGFEEPPLRWPDSAMLDGALDRSMSAAILLGFLVSPALLLAGHIRLTTAALRRSRWVAVASGVSFPALCILWFKRVPGRELATMISPGNYIKSAGILGTDVIPGNRPDVIPGFAMAMFALIGLVAISMLFVIGGSFLPRLLRVSLRSSRTASPSRTIASLALGGFCITTAAPAFLGMPLFDRYLLPVVALTTVKILGLTSEMTPSNRLDRWGAGISFVCLAFVGLVFAANSASFDGARWRAADRASVIVGDRNAIDGGFEWINFHAGRQVYFSEERLDGRYCIRMVISPDRESGWQGVVEPVWGPLRTQAWIVAEQRGPCS